MKRLVIIMMIVTVLLAMDACTSKQVRDEVLTVTDTDEYHVETTKPVENETFADERSITSATGVIKVHCFDNLSSDETGNKDKQQDNSQPEHTNPLEGASLTYTRIDNGTEYTTQSISSGVYHVEAIPAGHYLLRIQHPDCLELSVPVTLNLDDNIHDYELIEIIPDSTPYGKAEPRLEQFMLSFGDEFEGRHVLLAQLETDIMISSSDLDLQQPYPWLCNTARYHVEGILRSAEEREGMTKEQVEENSGDLFWPERFSQSRFPEVPRTGICYIPIPNPPGFQEGEPEFNFETLSGIELDYLDKLMQVYTERGFYFPYFAVCGEFNVAAMQESAYTVDNIVEFYDACIRKVREYYPNSEVGVSMNNIYEYGEWYTPPYASKEVWDSKVASGVIVTNVDFIKRLSDIGCPFDFVSTEIHPGETDHYSFDFLKWYCDELIKVGKKLYLWEFWLVGTNIDNYPESFFTGPTRHIIPEGGKDEINENAQAEILSEFLDYIASNPDMMGFHSDAELRDGTPIEQYASGRVPVNFGYWREDHSIKPVYYVHLNWLKSIRYVKKLDIQQEDYSFEAVPGSFQLIYYDDSGNVNNIIFELNEENNTIELP